MRQDSPDSELLFSGLSWADPTVELVQDNPCLTELITSVLALQDPSPSILSFTLQLAGILASSESRFQHLQVSQPPRYLLLGVCPLLLYGQPLKMCIFCLVKLWLAWSNSAKVTRESYNHHSCSVLM